MTFTLLTQSTDAEANAYARERLHEPCSDCGGRCAGGMMLLDVDEGPPVVVCEPCVSKRRILAVHLQPALLGMLVADEHAERAHFALELARHWNNGAVPIPAEQLGEPRPLGALVTQQDAVTELRAIHTRAADLTAARLWCDDVRALNALNAELARLHERHLELSQMLDQRKSA